MNGFGRRRISMERRWRERKKSVRAVYYILNSIDRQTSLEIREFTLPVPGPF